MANVDAATATVRLNGRHFRLLRDAILKAYNRDSLRQVLLFEMNERLEQIIRDAALSSQVFDLIDWAEVQGRTRELAEALRRGNPYNTELRGAVASLFPIQDLFKDDLEKIVVANPELFSNPD